MSHNEDSQHKGFTTGVVLGTILGGASLFLFGTKAGQRIKKQLSEEYAQGDFDLSDVHQKTNQKLEEFLKSSPFAKQFIDTVSQTIAKSTPKTPAKSKKNFFSKKGKKLG